MSQYTKSCNTCGKEIRMSKDSGKWLPSNLDGSAHRCLRDDRYTPNHKPEEQQQKGTPEDFVKEVVEGPYKESLKQIDARLRRIEKVLFNEQK